MKFFEIKDHKDLVATIPMILKDHEKDHKYLVIIYDRKINTSYRIFFGNNKYRDYIEHHDPIDRSITRARFISFLDRDNNTTHDNPFKANFWCYNVLNGDERDLMGNIKNILVIPDSYKHQSNV